MKNSNWTPEESALLLDETLCTQEIALRLKRSEAAVRGKRQRLSKSAPPIKTIAEAVKSLATYEKDRETVGADFWKRQFTALETKYRRALHENSAVEQLVSMASSLAPQSYDTAASVVVRPKAARGQPQSAVLMLSDTHVGQVVHPDQTLGFGLYNFDMFLARLKYLEDAVASILRDHVTTDLPELVVCLGGDMLHGNLNHSAEVAQIHTLFSQFYGAGHALAQFLRNLAAYVPAIRIQAVVGNHTRWGTQKRMPTDNRYSNLDSFLYAYVEALTKDIKTINWNLDRQPFALFDVQGFKFHLSHGDHLRGGDRALGIPNHAVGRMVSGNAQLFGKAGKPSPNYFLVGHMHRGIVLPHARGSVIVNGGFPGLDGFGLMEGFNPVDPTQVFFMVHPRYGKTATYDIQLKFAQVVAGVSPYIIPNNL